MGQWKGRLRHPLVYITGRNKKSLETDNSLAKRAEIRLRTKMRSVVFWLLFPITLKKTMKNSEFELKFSYHS